MRALAAYCLGGIVVALATCAIAAIIPVVPVSAGPVARDGAAVQWVNRSGKGDRLDISTVVRKERPPRPRPRKLSGCEPAFSPLAAAARADNYAGRCTAALGHIKLTIG